MSSITIPTPPETKYEISSDEFISAVQRLSFIQREWFYRKRGRDISNKEMFPDVNFEDDQLYIVLIETKCLSQDERLLEFLRYGGADFRPTFIFLKCILPGFNLSETFTNEWVFIHTYIEKGIRIETNSQIGNIKIGKDSWNENILLSHGGTCNNIIVFDSSRTKDIQIITDGKCGAIRVDNSSSCGDVLVIQNGKCRSIYISDESSMEQISLLRNSQIESIYVENGSRIEKISVLANSKCEDISIKHNSKCAGIRISNESEGGNIRIEEKSQFGDVEVTQNSKCKLILVGKGSQSKQVLIEKESQSGSILIEKGSRCRYIYIEKKSAGGFIWIDGGSHCKSIHVGDKSSADFVYIKNNSQCDALSFNSSKADSINVTKNSLVGPVSILGDSQIEMLEIHEGSLSGDIRIKNGKVGAIVIEHNFCSITLRNAIVSVMKITNCSLHQLVIETGVKFELYIDSCSINHLQLYKTSLLKDTIVSIINSKVYIIQLQELLIQGQFILRNIEVAAKPFVWQPRIKKYNQEENKIKMRDIHADKRALLEKLRHDYDFEVDALRNNPILKGHIQPLFRIVNSSLGKTEITGSNLTGFHFEYRDSKLLEVFISGTQLPREKIDIYNEELEASLPNKVYFEQKISIYNQLKRIFENQGDIVEGTWYHAKAMANQQRLLSLYYDERPGKLPRKWWSEEAFDLFNFWLNKKSNNHGESWRRALCFSFYVLFSIYILYFISANWGRPFEWSGTGDFIGNFFSFLDITHKIDFMVDKEKLNGFAKFLDFFGRIATGYCIFQFIAAFRRHGKKG
ncbi:hypothetical protein GFS24_28205 [Chitinophaga sp. SYP-B3965]|uniref:hypothetical protein n=1 Tax=Chitinophaga sp. SYP-B3965 TaxID=2663120 RepID=UPI0012999CD9|nr:hypothetical protein [Chitinophaga sp. SYP-B3965]MRG49025.1 hypothetical protein [Chitinophaga sp. SYP-B3965]